MDTSIATMFNILGKDYIQGFLLGLTFGALAMIILALYIFSKFIYKSIYKEKEALINQYNKDMDRMLKILDIADTKKGEKALSNTLSKVWETNI